ncbi:MAG: thioredoxin [Bacteroides sp.]|nr:thioredoxin [Bacteroides sp.]
MAYKFTDENVKEAIASGHPIVIDFWATWCGPCMALAPAIDELAEEFADQVVIGKYNVDEETELSGEYRIMSIPTILFFKNGEQVRDLRMTGANKEELRKRIEKLLVL